MKKIGKYNLVRKLGGGTTSTVYLAVDQFNEQKVALKLLNFKSINDKHHLQLFRKQLITEASLAGKLNHPHIVRVEDAVLEGETNYIVMEYVEGSTLEYYAEVDHLLPINRVAEIIYKCCKAMEYAQSQGVIHRDLKPANILLRGETDIKIADFGAAILYNDQATQVAGIGSPAYMSPEQVQEIKLNHQSDIYSLGVVMYRLLTGKLPFDASNNSSMIYQIINIEEPSPSLFRPEIPPAIDSIVRKAMEKDLSLRYQTWQKFAQDLVAFFNHTVVSKTELYDTEKFDTLRKLGFFKHFSDVQLWEVLHLSRWRKVASSEFILQEGETGRSFYILAQGTVRVLKQDRLLSLLHRGDCFGEMAHLAENDARRNTDVQAKNDVTLIEIDPNTLAKASSECRFQFSDAFLKMLVKRLSIANTRLTHLLSEKI